MRPSGKDAKLKQIEEASSNWKDTLDRNYNLLRRVKEASDSGKKALDDLCPSPADDQAFKPEVGRNVPQICPMKGLAPEFLISKAQAADGSAHTSSKLAEFRDYNVLSFGGGGESIEYHYEMHASDFSYTVTDTKQEGSAKLLAGASVGLRTPIVGFGFETEILGGGSTAFLTMKTRTETAADDSSALFHLEDPDLGTHLAAWCWVTWTGISQT